MTQSNIADTTVIRLRRFILSILILWTAVICISFAANSLQEYVEAKRAARIENRSTFNKDIAYRRWSASHGGVYVTITDNSPPNPYLSDIPERDLTTPSGRKLTLINPAYMTRQVHEIGADEHGVRGHITSLDPIRPGNAPDEWERASLEAIARGDMREVSMITKIDGELYMRLMQPLYTEEGCLKCHAQYGSELGTLRGGISVSTPMKPHLANAMSGIFFMAGVHGAFWIAGLGGILFGGHRFTEQFQKRMDAEDEREHLLKTLAFRNEELESVIRASTHDLKSPIVNILGFSTELHENCNQVKAMLKELSIPPESEQAFFDLLDNDISESLEYICSSAAKVNDLQNGLLEVCQLGREDLNIETVDMNQLVEKVISDMQYQIKESGAILHLDKLPSCRCDKRKLSRVFTNLVDNAIKYRDPDKRLEIHIFGKIDGSKSVYCVEDNGIGIAFDYHEKIFEIFHRLHSNGACEGQGLGLTIVRKIVQRQEGWIYVKSEPGKGSRFFVEMPVS